ncbi:MAG TPA: plastocyanin/azurin family copper-binding protein [Solirubrobacteraceae bacterium]
MKRPLLLTLPLALVALAGCGSSSSSSSAPSTSSSSTSASAAPATSSGSGAGAAVQVMMKNLAFSPASVTANVGQTVQWTNQDTPPHNIFYVSGPKFTSSPTLNTGGQFKLKLTQPGTIHYICSIHPFMKATIVVTK